MYHRFVAVVVADDVVVGSMIVGSVVGTIGYWGMYFHLQRGTYTVHHVQYDIRT
jgi:hypothetical protein